MGLWALAGGGSLLVETLLTAVTAFQPARDYIVGAPFPIGLCHVDFPFSPANTCAFGPYTIVLYLFNVFLTTLVFIVIGGWYGPRAIPGAVVAALVASRFPLRFPDGAVIPFAAWIVVDAVAAIAGYASTHAPREWPNVLADIWRHLRGQSTAP